MDNNKEEIEKLIEEEKKELAYFLKIAEDVELDEAEIEKQVNFYLERITKLKNRLEK